MNSTIKSGLVLFVICLVASFALGIVNGFTFERIEAMKYDTTAYQSMMKVEKYTIEEELGTSSGVTHIFAGKDGEDLVGYVYSVVVTGYGGPITMAVAIDTNKIIQGYIITDDSETKSLGGKAKDESFINQFVGKTGQLKSVKKDAANNNEISAITGATITTDAVIKGVNLAMTQFESMNE